MARYVQVDFEDETFEVPVLETMSLTGAENLVENLIPDGATIRKPSMVTG